MPYKRILVIKLRHIGDVLLTAPVFRALRESYPEARISALVPSGTQDMLSLNPNIDEIIQLKKGRGGMDELAFVKSIRDRRFDLVINMTEGDRGAILSMISGAKMKIGVDPLGRGFWGKKLLFNHLVKMEYDGRHRVVMDLNLLEPLGIFVDKPRVELFVSADDERQVADMLLAEGIGPDTSTAVVHPTSRWMFKCWRDDAMAGVIDYLEGRGIRVILTSGPDKKEKDRIKSILALTKTNPVDYSGKLSLKKLAAVMKRSALFFGVDTAPMHMAAAVGIPVVALFGPSDFKVWGPYTDRSIIIAKTAEFPCVPCKADGCNGTKKSACLDAITVDDAVKAIDEILNPNQL